METNGIANAIIKIEESLKHVYYIDRTFIRKLIFDYKGGTISLEEFNSGLIKFRDYMNDNNKDGIKNVMSTDEYNQAFLNMKRQMKEQQKSFIEKNGIRDINRKIEYYKNKKDNNFDLRYKQKCEELEEKLRKLYISGEGIEELEKTENIEMNLMTRRPALEAGLINAVNLLISLTSQREENNEVIQEQESPVLEKNYVQENIEVKEETPKIETNEINNETIIPINESQTEIVEFKDANPNILLNAKNFFKNAWHKDITKEDDRENGFIEESKNLGLHVGNEEEKVEEAINEQKEQTLEEPKNDNAEESSSPEINEQLLGTESKEDNYSEENNEETTNEPLEAVIDEKTDENYEKRIEKLKQDLERTISESLPTDNAQKQGEFISSLFKGMEEEEKVHGK